MGKRKLLTKLTQNELKELVNYVSNYRVMGLVYEVTIMFPGDLDDDVQFVIWEVVRIDDKNGIWKTKHVAYGYTFNEVRGQFDAYIKGLKYGK